MDCIECICNVSVEDSMYCVFLFSVLYVKLTSIWTECKNTHRTNCSDLVFNKKSKTSHHANRAPTIIKRGWQFCWLLFLCFLARALFQKDFSLHKKIRERGLPLQSSLITTLLIFGMYYRKKAIPFQSPRRVNYWQKMMQYVPHSHWWRMYLSLEYQNLNVVVMCNVWYGRPKISTSHNFGMWIGKSFEESVPGFWNIFCTSQDSSHSVRDPCVAINLTIRCMFLMFNMLNVSYVSNASCQRMNKTCVSEISRMIIVSKVTRF